MEKILSFFKNRWWSFIPLIVCVCVCVCVCVVSFLEFTQ